MKRIIIVGSSSGIGKAMAEQWLRHGHRVGVTGRRNELLQEIAVAFPGQVETACFDVQGADRVTELEALEKRLGGMDILVISAGIGLPADGLSWELDKCTIDTNVDGFTALANWGFNYFVRQGHGQLAAISSVAAHRGGSIAPAYNASKAYQSSYLEGLAIKAHRMKVPIAITVTEPGFVNTRMALGDGLFWVVPVEKAARQIIRAIETRKRRAFISRRWALIARIMRIAPFSLYRRFV